MLRVLLGSILCALVIAILCPLAKAQPKTIAAGKCSTQINRSKVCRGISKGFARDFAASLMTRLGEKGPHRVVLPKVAGSGGRAVDLFLSVDVLCFPDHLEVNLSLVDVTTTAVVWAKTNSINGMAQIPLLKKRMVRELSQFGSDSGSKARARKSTRYTLALVPIQAGPGVLDDKSLGQLTELLWSKMYACESFRLVPAGESSRFFPRSSAGKPVDDKRVLSVGDDLGAERAVLVEVQKTGNECSVSWALFDVAGKKRIRTGLLRGSCSVEGVGQALVEIVDKVAE